MAVNFDEDVEWIKQKKEYILPVCYVRDFLQSSSRLFNLYFNQEQQPAPIPALSVLTLVLLALLHLTLMILHLAFQLLLPISNGV